MVSLMQQSFIEWNLLNYNLVKYLLLLLLINQDILLIQYYMMTHYQLLLGMLFISNINHLWAVLIGWHILPDLIFLQLCLYWLNIRVTHHQVIWSQNFPLPDQILAMSDANWGPQDALVSHTSSDLPLFISRSMSAFIWIF
jgi:hypothetical protein